MSNDTRNALGLLPALVIPMLLGAGPAVAGEIYTWKDAQGVVHYSDVKPGNTDAKVLRAGSHGSVSEYAPPPSKPGATPADQEVNFQKRRTEAAEAQTKADKERQQAATLKENCETARNQLSALRSGERMARYNAAGEKEVLDDSAREAEINRVQRIVDGSCK